jgi:hypothetical protein
MRSPPHSNEIRELIGFRSNRAEFKKLYHVAPKGVSWCAIPTVLLESQVWGTLGIYERRFIDAILIVHARAGGRENGRLILTHDTLKDRGIKGDKIRRTIANLVSSGLLEVTHKGRTADPSRYRVTFLSHKEEIGGRVSFYPPTNDWIEIEIQIIEGRRQPRPKLHEPPAQKIDSQRSKNGPV